MADLLYADRAARCRADCTGLPARNTAAMPVVHAIEAYTSRHKKTRFGVAAQALRLLSSNLVAACK